MKKNKFFLLAVAIIAIFIFSVAAVCNQCALLSPSTDSSEQQKESGIKETAADGANGKEDSQVQETSVITQADISEDTSENAGPNSDPVIEKLLLSSAENGAVFLDIMNPQIQEDVLQKIYVGMGEVTISITASDKNGDKLLFEAIEDNSREIDVNVLSAIEAEFLWSPSETGPIAIKVRVADGKGGETEYDINMNVLSAEEMMEDSEESTEEHIEAELFEGIETVQPDAGISGYIIKDTEVKMASASSGAPYIMVGDNNSNKQIKGYLSFDISRFHGKAVTDARINFSDFEIVNNPGFAEFLDVKVFIYGNTLDLPEFSVGGQSVARIPTSSGSYIITGETLKNELQKTFDASAETYFPLKLGLSSATNSNGVTDVINIYLSNVSLEFNYTD